MKIDVIQFTPASDYKKNLEKLRNLIQNSTAKLIIAPEVIITDFDYKNWEKANNFAETIKKEIIALSKKRIIVLIRHLAFL